MEREAEESFADHRPLTLIESYRYKNIRGEGVSSMGVRGGGREQWLGQRKSQEADADVERVHMER
jgi:hypothetical protein